MKAFGLFIAFLLMVCFIGSIITSDRGSSYAQASTIKGTQIPIQLENNALLDSVFDIGPMAVSPNGATVFAGLQNESTGDWDLLRLRSINSSAFTCQDTGLSNATAAIADTGDIVAVELSPSWNTDGRVYVTTENRVYWSKDRGLIFEGLAAVPGTVYYGGAVPPYDVITSLDLGLDADGNIVVAVGTLDGAWGGEVYILDEGTWSTGTPPPHPVGAAVLAVGLSPNYATDQAVIAVVTDGIKTMVRTKRLAGGWGATISNATIKDQDANDFASYRACIGLPDDYNATSQTGSVLTCFVGLSAAGPRGDIFRINGGWMSPSTFTDLNVRGTVGADPSETNIWSMAVSGSASNIVIIVGTEAVNPSALPSPPGQFLVYTSLDSGGSWKPNNSDYLSYKQPTGQAKATVVMTPFIAYAGTFGDQSAVSAAESEKFNSWNQCGLYETTHEDVPIGTQEWTQISIPDTGDMQLAPNTDVGVIAVSPDGATLFAAVVIESTGGWSVYKSVNGGYTWKVTGYNGDGTPTEQIVAIDMSPNWANDDRIYVATQDDVYSSNDCGKTFNSRNAITDSDGVSINYITSMDVGLDEDGDAVVVIGSDNSFAPDPDVYILGEGGWDAQGIYYSANGGYGVTSNNYGVLSVAFSPNYGEDGVVFAAIRGYAPLEGEGTHLRAESDITVNNWGSYIRDGHFVDEETLTNIVADSACMDFADDYNSVPAVFVGLTSYNLTNPVGDAFRVDLVMGAMGTSAVSDLGIRGENSSTNVNSLAVSGPEASAFILAGLRDLSLTGPMSTWQGQVHYSSNGGESWLQSYKPPSGLNFATQRCAPTLVMAPDFAASGIAYCGNGYIPGSTESFSGFYVSTTQGTTWNGRGLLELDIDSISDTVPSPDYDNDNTLFMVTRDTNLDGTGLPFGFLWETKDGGNTWELILGMTLMQPLPGVNIDTVRIPATYPDEPSVFVTGPDDLFGSPSARLVRSTDEGNLFATTLNGPYYSGVPLVIDTWIVYDKDTLIVSNGSNIFKTTDMGAHWNLPGAADIDVAAGEKIIDMQRYKDTNTLLAGTDRGNVYLCQDWQNDFSFLQVSDGPGGARDVVHVAFDTNFDDNGIIYAGIFGINCGIWRVDANSAGEWEQIWDTEDIYSIACDGNGILWAIDDNGIRSAAIRCVSPTGPIDGLEFEYITNGLTSDLWSDLEITPTWTHVFAIGGASNNELWAIIPPVEPWDVNGDSSVNVLDMIRIGQHWGQTGSPGWIPEDVNKDGAINVLDMIIIGQHWTG